MTIINLITTIKFIDEIVIFDSDHNLIFKGGVFEATKFYSKEIEEFWVVDHQPNKDPNFTTLCITVK